MLEIRQFCENCGIALPNESTEAMICSFECTYCKDCVNEVLFNVCPSCGGGFEKRPQRTNKYLKKYPPSEQHLVNPPEEQQLLRMLKRYKDVPPNKR